MKLNRIEKALMNNPVRALLQKYYEAGLLEELGGRVEGGCVLEMGCGRGVGTEIIFERFGAREVWRRHPGSQLTSPAAPGEIFGSCCWRSR